MLLPSVLLLGVLGAPEQVHVAHRGSASFWVSWMDFSANASSTGTVDAAGRAFTAESISYQFQAKTAPSVYSSPQIFHVVVADVECGREYNYRVKSAGKWSTTFLMNTPACTAGADQGVSIGVIGDLGQTPNTSQTIELLLDSLSPSSDVKLDQVWLVGDLSYADAAYGPDCWMEAHGGCHPERWDTWGRLVEPLTSRLTLQVLPGNHEQEYSPAPAIGAKYVEYESRMRTPINGAGPFYYSWETANVHMISLNSYQDFSSSSDMYKWLEKDLQSVDRSKTPWVFVGTHAPWYNSNKHHQNETEEWGMRVSMEPLMKKYAVDALICGHVHAYERSYPVYDNVVTEGAMMEFNIGDGGNREVLEDDDWVSPQPAWSAFRKNGFGHGIIQTLNSTHAIWTWHTINSPELHESDRVMLIKNSFLSHVHVNTGVRAYQL